MDNSKTFCVALALNDNAKRAFLLNHNSKFLTEVVRPVQLSRKRRRREVTPPFDYAQDMPARLAFTLEEDHWESLVQGLTFGSDPSCDVLLDTTNARGVSRCHFRLSFQTLHSNDPNIFELHNLSETGIQVDEYFLNDVNQTYVFGRTGLQVTAGRTKFLLKIPNRNECENQVFYSIWDRFMSWKRMKEVRRPILAPPSVWDVTPRIVVSAYKREARIGSGKFGKVYRVLSLDDGKRYAQKVINVNDRKRLHLLDREVGLMKQLPHRHILQLITTEIESNSLHIIMELADFGDLRKFFSELELGPGASPGRESLSRQVTWQILGALEFLHGADVVHRDVKEDNILVVKKDPFTAKLSDFGLSRQLIEDSALSFLGTLGYCAPEVFPDGGSVYDCSRDIFAFGVVLYQLLTGSSLFRLRPRTENETAGDYFTRLYNLVRRPFDQTKLTDQGVSATSAALVAWMLDPDRSRRPTASQCLEHEWIDACRPGDTSSVSLYDTTFFFESMSPQISASKAASAH